MALFYKNMLIRGCLQTSNGVKITCNEKGSESVLENYTDTRGFCHVQLSKVDIILSLLKKQEKDNIKIPKKKDIEALL